MSITRLPSNQRPADHPQVRAFSYTWYLSVTWQRWRSHNLSRYSRKPHAACRLHGSMFYRSGVIADWSSTLQE